MKLPTDLIYQLRDNFGTKTFIEGGTYYGATAVWAAQHFNSVITIEAQAEIYQATAQKYAHVTNIDFRLGNTRDVLSDVIADLDGSAVFWLDAHWSVANTYGEEDECPLLDELAIISQALHKQYLFIDDASLFLAPPPKPHRIENWPTIAQIVHALDKFPYPIYTVIVDNIIVCVPQDAYNLVSQYYQTLITERYHQSVATTISRPNIKKSVKHLLKSFLR